MAEVLTLLVLLTLASYRLTRLVTADYLLQGLFDRLRERSEMRWMRKYDIPHPDPEQWRGQIAYLVSCHWCLGFWVAGALTLITALTVGVPYPLLMWPAVATLVGLLGRLDGLCP